MKIVVKNLEHAIVSIALLLSLTSWAQQPDPKFSKSEVFKDLTYLYGSLIDAHYNLYAYTSKGVFEVNYSRGKSSQSQIIRVNGSEKQEGVQPSIIIKDHLLDKEDEILNGLLKKLN